jgi:hypothetical protein
MRKMIFIALAALPLAAAAQNNTGAAPKLTLYSSPAYLGSSVTIDAATPDLATLGFARRAQSARVSGGAWVLCPQTAYAGTCRTISGNTPLLSRSSIVSVRPQADAAAATTTAAGGSTTVAAAATVDIDALDVDEGVEGQDASFFARPSLGGTQISAGTNDRTTADAFCRLAGYASSLNAGRARAQASNILDISARTRVRGYALRDVLCRR